jgi:hypothetical protein
LATSVSKSKQRLNLFVIRKLDVDVNEGSTRSNGYCLTRRPLLSHVLAQPPLDPLKQDG